jgi:O-antigen/teichoic acid export membrane protein
MTRPSDSGLRDVDASDEVPGARDDHAGVTSRAPSLGRDASMVTAVRMFGSLSSGVLVIILGRLLGPSEYGLYSLALAMAVAAEAISDQGIPAATNRFVSEAYPDVARMRGLFLRGLRAKTVVVGLVALAVFAVAGPIARLMGAPHAVTLMRAAALTVLVQDLYTFLVPSFIAVRRTLGSAAIALTKAAVEFAVAIVLVLAGLGALGGILGNAAGYTLADTVGVGLLLVVYLRAGHGRADHGAVSTRRLLAYGRQVWVAEVIWAGFGFVDQFFLQAYKGSAAVGVYAVAWRMIVPLQHVAIAFSLALSSRLATLSHEQRSATFERGFRALAAFYAGGGVLCLVLAGPAMRTLFGARYAEAGAVFAALVPMTVMMAFGPILSSSLNVLGAARERKWVTSASLATNVVGDILLIPRMGVVGPAVASDAAYAVLVVGHIILCRRVLTFSMMRVTRSALIGTLAGGVGAVGTVAALVSPIHPPIARVAMAAMLGLMSMIVSLVLMREWDRDLLRMLRR